jgi:hypothetical protein
LVRPARGGALPPPAAVHGAVLIEAVPFPKGTHPAGPAALIQVWPEPKLAWRATNGVKVSSVLGDDGKRLAIDTSRPPIPVSRAMSPRGVIIIRNADGSARVVRDGENLSGSGQFQPNARQALVKCQGDTSTTTARELRLTILGTVRSGIEPLARADGLKENGLATGTSHAGIEMTVQYSKNANGRFVVTVSLGYERATVERVGVGAELPGANGGGPGRGNQTIHGVRITDADGKPFMLGLVGGSGRSSSNTREVMSLTLELHPDKDGNGPPAVATFWGTYAKPVEIPIVLADVPLGGK